MLYLLVGRNKVMEQYISKAAVKAELEGRAKYNSTRAELDRSAFMAGREKEDEEILAFLDTLDVKETPDSNDLEKEIENELDRTWCGEYIDTDKFKESAVYFFELGLKAKVK